MLGTLDEDLNSIWAQKGREKGAFTRMNCG